jgi:hypothetical protein
MLEMWQLQNVTHCLILLQTYIEIDESEYVCDELYTFSVWATNGAGESAGASDPVSYQAPRCYRSVAGAGHRFAMPYLIAAVMLADACLRMWPAENRGHASKLSTATWSAMSGAAVG